MREKKSSPALTATIAAVLTLFVLAVIAVASSSLWTGKSPQTLLLGSDESRPGLSMPVGKKIDLGGLPEDGAKEVNPGKKITVNAAGGVVEDVVIEDESGQRVSGKRSDDSSKWSTSERLKFNTHYTVQTRVKDTAGQVQNKKTSFSTVSEANEADAWMYPMPDQTVGVGQPVEIRFSEPVENKAQVLQAISVTSNSQQEVRARWVSDTKLRFRAEEFWKANSDISIEVNLFGVDLGNGQIGNFDDSWKLKIGDKKVAVADAATKRMVMYINDEEVQNYPVTMGDEEWPSSDGVNVVMDQFPEVEFNAGTIGIQPGDPKWYEPFTAKNASRLSNTGEFVHQATESGMGALGERNISHGCIGMSPEASKYFLDTWGRGDVVEIKNAGGSQPPLESGMADYNVPWDRYANTPTD